VDFVLTHLDGRKIRIKNEPGQVVKPEDIKTVEGFGMPFHKTSYKFGNLFILFKIKFPEQLKAEQLEPLRAALSAQKGKAMEEEAEETVKL
jgi:DnaJ family protein A protein 2